MLINCGGESSEGPSSVLAFRIADSCAFHWFRMPPVLMSIVASIPFSFPKNMRLCVQKKESNQYSSREGGRGKGEGEGEGQGERERRKVEGSRKRKEREKGGYFFS